MQTQSMSARRMIDSNFLFRLQFTLTDSNSFKNICEPDMPNIPYNSYLIIYIHIYD